MKQYDNVTIKRKESIFLMLTERMITHKTFGTQSKINVKSIDTK